MVDVETLREKYPEFIYHSFAHELKEKTLSLSFSYTLKSDHFFTHTVTISRASGFPQNIPNLDLLVFNLGLVEMFSYWKTTVSPTISIEAGGLDESQKKWWKNLLINGMGEFFYRNKIDFTAPDFVEIVSNSTKVFEPVSHFMQNRYIVPIGGGKDSIVSLLIVQENNLPHTYMLANPNPAMKEIVEKTHERDPIVIEQNLDSHLLELNDSGKYLNGHIPFSAKLGFFGILCCVLFDYQTVLVSNERSSNEGNVVYKGKKINHQYSKTFDFEKQFADYTKNYLAQDARYLSFLRPLYETQISRIFARYSHFFPVFKSCNVGRGKIWCGQCPKCLFVYLSLFPFVKREELTKIFNKDLLDDQKLQPLLFQLAGITGVKPFECVGTQEEVKCLLFLALQKYEKEKLPLPVLLQIAKVEILTKETDWGIRAEKILTSWDDDNLLDEKLKTILKQYATA